MKSNPSETKTAYFSVHVTCPTVYRSQIVSKAVCPTWCTYLYQEREKSRPPLENSSSSPLPLWDLTPPIWALLATPYGLSVPPPPMGQWRPPL